MTWRIHLLWLSSLLLLPLLWAQGLYARARTPRLPEASGEPSGDTGNGGETLRLVVLGESPVAGVGVERYAESLTARMAERLAQLRGCRVSWVALGENGIDATGACERLVPRVAGLRPDLVVVVLGVNDTAGLTPRERWRRAIGWMTAELRRDVHGPIVFAPVPPMQSFVALPQPLRSVLGARAAMLDRDLARAVTPHRGVVHAPVLVAFGREYLARDGYHPSRAGCEVWGARLAEFADPLLNDASAAGLARQ